jgi:hypothetical protein
MYVTLMNRSGCFESRFAVGFILFAMVSGNFSCTVNDFGLATVRHYENETCDLASVEAWGVYLSTRSVDSGLTLGYAKRLYVYPKPHTAQRSKAAASILVLGATAPHPSRPPTLSLQPLEEAVAVFSDSRGLVVSANRYGVDLAIGIRWQAMLQLPSSADTVLLINYQSGHQSGIKACLIGGAP